MQKVQNLDIFHFIYRVAALHILYEVLLHCYSFVHIVYFPNLIAVEFFFFRITSLC